MMKKLALNMMLLASVPFNSYAENKHIHHDWSYENGEKSPENWGKLSPKYSTCSTGKEQSPIDIQSKNAVSSKLPELKFDYTSIPLLIENNGHTIQVNTERQAGKLQIGTVSYELLQFHAHAPSEESIDGKRADMVVHLVHKNAAGEYAVVGLLFDKDEQDNPALQKIWERMPTTEGEAVKHDVKIDVSSLLPADRNYYAFAGSFTTPPCTEGVKWIILKQKLTLSAAQLARFKTIIHDNARPIQPLNARKVLSSN